MVVDNGSTDATPQVVDAAKAVLPIEPLTEPRPGKNRALNKGLEALEGSLAIITDDDAVPDPMFLAAWSKYLDSKSNYALFGGGGQTAV